MSLIATRSMSFFLVDSRYTGKASCSDDHVRVFINLVRVSRVILIYRLQENNSDILYPYRRKIIRNVLHPYGRKTYGDILHPYRRKNRRKDMSYSTLLVKSTILRISYDFLTRKTHR